MNKDVQTVVDFILGFSLKEIIQVQLALAKEGVCLTIGTGEIMMENPSLGETAPQPASPKGY